ncbi:PucR family transcriptional regulator [Streptomyces sp. CB03234]|uniref:PucR family transcriptional regulator n=1 Tax=Streptomyces sp. (strain CB03234) TaxID=1703937 RepID=UPI0009A171B8|nr:PucR family transcriptional regulator [Streptomyces sp. CB03234]
MAATAPVPAPAPAPSPVPAPVTGSCLDLLSCAKAQGRRPRTDELAALRNLAAAAAARGVALHTLVGEWLAAACRSWPAEAGGSEPPALLQAVRDVTVALTEGYETGYGAAVRREEAVRRECVDDLRDGRTDLGRLVERADRFVLRLAGRHRVAVARAAAPFRAGDAATHYVEDGMAAAFGVRDVLITTKDSLLVCVSPAAEADVPRRYAAYVREAGAAGHRIAVSRQPSAVSRPRLGAGGIVRRYQEARSTLDLADRLDLAGPLVDASGLLVFQVLGRDRAAITGLVATVLGGPERARGGPRPLPAALTAYFAAGRVTTTTAHRLGLSVRAVGYRLARVRRLTGYDPADPDQRYTLHTATLGARLLDWPARDWPARPLEHAD